MAAVIPPALFEPIGHAIGDLFKFSDLDLILYGTTGDRVINEIANEKWPSRQVALETLNAVEREGTTRLFLASILGHDKSDAALQALILQIPGLTPGAAETKERVGTAIEGLRLTQLELGDSAVREAILRSRRTFEDCADGVSVLDAYKNLHDALHQLQIRRLGDLRAAARAIATDPLQEERLRDFKDRLFIAQHTADRFARKLPPHSLAGDTERDWIAKIGTSATQLEAALNNADVAATQAALALALRVLEREPVRLNGLIFRSAKLLPLQDLVDTLESARGTNKNIGGFLAPTCQALRDIRGALLARVTEHHHWQEVDEEMHELDRAFILAGELLLTDFAVHWPLAKNRVAALATGASEEGWAKKLREYAENVDDEIARAEGESGPEGGTLSKAARDRLQRRYVNFRQEARLRFFFVDGFLKDDCAQIVAIGGPLRSILGSLT